MANEEHLAILRNGVAVWNRWREENPDVQIDLRSADLRDENLSGANFRNAALSGCNFHDAFLNKTDFSSADLRSAQLTGAQIREASFVGANLEGTGLTQADASDADFSEAYMKGSVFISATLARAILSKTHCRDSNFNAADLSQAVLLGTDFRDSHMEGARFTGASLENADLMRCDCRNAYFHAANLKNANLRRAKLAQADFTEAKLTYANLLDVTELTCEQLILAIDWETTYRDTDLACGEAIPDLNAPSAAADDSTGNEKAQLLKGIDGLLGELERFPDELPRTGETVALVEPLNETPGPGHNNPPEPLPIEVVSDNAAEFLRSIATEIQNLRSEVTELRGEIDRETPNPAALNEKHGVVLKFRGDFLTAMATNMGKWCSRIILTGIGSIFGYIAGIGDQLLEVANSLLMFLRGFGAG